MACRPRTSRAAAKLRSEEARSPPVIACRPKRSGNTPRATCRPGKIQRYPWGDSLPVGRQVREHRRRGDGRLARSAARRLSRRLSGRGAGRQVPAVAARAARPRRAMCPNGSTIFICRSSILARPPTRSGRIRRPSMSFAARAGRRDRWASCVSRGAKPAPEPSQTIGFRVARYAE